MTKIEISQQMGLWDPIQLASYSYQFLNHHHVNVTSQPFIGSTDFNTFYDPSSRIQMDIFLTTQGLCDSKFYISTRVNKRVSPFKRLKCTLDPYMRDIGFEKDWSTENSSELT